MNKRIFWIAVPFIIATLSFQINAQPVFLPSGTICINTNEEYKLVFNDEFNVNELDLSKWKTYIPDGPNGSDQCSFCRTHSLLGNEEGQIYRDANVTVSGGTAKLTVKRESGKWYEFTKDFTSGILYSNQSFNTYSKFEIRCKLPSGCGFWSAFWVFGWSTEIDIFEDGCLSDTYESSVHNTSNNHKTWKSLVDPNVDLSQDFHIYSVEYEPAFVKFFFDGQLKLTMPKYYLSNGQSLTSCDIVSGWYSLEPEFPTYGNPVNIIANVAVGHNYSDGTTTPYTPAPTSSTILPQSMEIDYIRAYQKQPQSDLSDICKSMKINGPFSLCFSDSKKDTMMYCFDGPLDSSTTFTASTNIQITQNPAFDLIKKNISININGILIDTFYYDTLKHFGCIRVTPKANSQNEFGSITINTINEACGPKIITLPIQIGIPYPQINHNLLNPCRNDITLSTVKYDKDTNIEWSIYSYGNLSSSPTIYYTYQNEVYIELQNQRRYNGAYFYVKLKITSKCGTKEVVQKILIPDKDCKNIEYIISPNPTNGISNIQLNESDMINDISKIYIKNALSGIIVLNRTNILSSQDLTLDLTNLQNGNYTVTIENNEGQLFSKPIQIIR